MRGCARGFAREGMMLLRDYSSGVLCGEDGCGWGNCLFETGAGAWAYNALVWWMRMRKVIGGSKRWGVADVELPFQYGTHYEGC